MRALTEMKRDEMEIVLINTPALLTSLRICMNLTPFTATQQAR